jgi:PhzF family phenazine biosynthesis protein
MNAIECYQVDAFTNRAFAGNPACVCPLESWLSEPVLSAIARENAAPATAFFVRRGSEFELRWFTPTSEIELCGHGTLASAFVLMTEIDSARTSARFHTKSGLLEVTRDAARFALDLPALPSRPAAPPPGIAEALGLERACPTLDAGRRWMFVLARAEEVRALRPDFGRLLALPNFGAALVTAPGTGQDSDVDFVSRYFAPHYGLSEDAATGSAHCALTPYWAVESNKNRFVARQVSERGGELTCELRGERVRLSGEAVLVKRGVFLAPDRAEM